MSNEVTLEQALSLPSKSTQEQLCRAAVWLAAKNGQVTSDDVRAGYSVAGDKRIIGSALAFLSKNGIIAKIGIKNSLVPGSGSRAIMAFALTQNWRVKYAELGSYELCPWMVGLEAKSTVADDAGSMDAELHIAALLAACDHVDVATGKPGGWQAVPELQAGVKAAREFLASIRAVNAT